MNGDYDVLVIGAGQAGIPLAHALAKAGRRVALAERSQVGGSCVNFGCTPTKAAIASAKLAHRARHAADLGLRIPGVEVDFPAVLARARRIVDEFRQGLEEEFQPGGNPELLRGHARLDGRAETGFRARVGERHITAAQVVLDTGTRSLIPSIPGLPPEEVIHAGNWLDHTELPQHLLMIGGGYIGLEMAQFYRRMGSRVTVIERSGQIAGREDPEVSSAIQELLEREEIRFLLDTSILAARRDGENLTLTVETDGSRRDLTGTHVFVATGRLPNTDDLGLETVGVRMNDHGIVEVDERLRTSVEGVWAAGDIRGGPMFTHTSWDDYRVLYSQIAGDGWRTTRRVLVYAVFTEPQLGRAGMTELEARKAGYSVQIGRYDMKHNSRAIETGEEDGFIKLVVDAKTDRILGATVMSTEGAELVHMYADLMNANAPYTVIRDAIHIHPTLAEAVQSAAGAVTGAEWGTDIRKDAFKGKGATP